MEEKTDVAIFDHELHCSGKKNQTPLRDLEQIEYRHGLLDPGMKPSDLPVRVWRGAEIHSEVHKAINEEKLLNLGGVYGDKAVGDPVEYDHLKIVLPDDVVEIEFFNRGITLFTTDDETARSIHRVFCKLSEPPSSTESS